MDRPVVESVTDILEVQMNIAHYDAVSFNLPNEQSIVRGLDSRSSKDCQTLSKCRRKLHNETLSQIFLHMSNHQQDTEEDGCRGKDWTDQ